MRKASKSCLDSVHFWPWPGNYYSKRKIRYESSKRLTQNSRLRSKLPQAHSQAKEELMARKQLGLSFVLFVFMSVLLVFSGRAAAQGTQLWSSNLASTRAFD